MESDSTDLLDASPTLLLGIESVSFRVITSVSTLMFMAGRGTPNVDPLALWPASRTCLRALRVTKIEFAYTSASWSVFNLDQNVDFDSYIPQ